MGQLGVAVGHVSVLAIQGQYHVGEVGKGLVNSLKKLNMSKYEITTAN